MPAFVIQTFTVSYDAHEDRVRLAAVDKTEQVQAIWLTRRLLDRLLPALVRTLDTQVSDAMPLEFAQSLQQEQVRQGRRLGDPPEAVDAQQSTCCWLCSTVHVTKSESGVELTLTDGTQEATMSLGAVQLRVVLDIFAATYRTADWALSAFPAWLIETDPPETARAWVN